MHDDDTVHATDDDRCSCGTGTWKYISLSSSSESVIFTRMITCNQQQSMITQVRVHTWGLLSARDSPLNRDPREREQEATPTR